MGAAFDVPLAVVLAATDGDGLIRYVAGFLASVQPGAFVLDYEGALEVADAIADAHMLASDGRILRPLLPGEERPARALDDLVAAAQERGGAWPA